MSATIRTNLLSRNTTTNLSLKCIGDSITNMLGNIDMLILSDYGVNFVFNIVGNDPLTQIFHRNIAIITVSFRSNNFSNIFTDFR